MNKIKIGVIPAAGRGTRMGYLSNIIPKCLFPVYDKPIIHTVIDNMASIGIEKVYVIVNYQKDKIMSYIDQVKDTIPIDFNFIEQEQLLGIANSISLTQPVIGEPFLVILGDDFTSVNSLQNIVDRFLKNKAIVVEGIINENDVGILRSTCCVELKNNKSQIKQIVEKPPQPFSKVRGCGIYLFQPDIFDYIKRTPKSLVRGEIEITDVINSLAKEELAYGEFIQGINININSYTDLLKASIIKTTSQNNQNVYTDLLKLPVLESVLQNNKNLIIKRIE